MSNLRDLLNGFTRSAWRLEALDDYDISDERDQFNDFLAGRTPQPSPDDLAWRDRARAVVASGRSIGRVRMVGRPVTDYTRFEWDAYPENIAAGEQVRVYDRSWPGGSEPEFDHDVWVFDDEVAAVMHYDNHGGFHGIRIADDVTPYLRMKHRALARSVPFHEYVLLPEPRREGQTGQTVPTRKDQPTVQR